MTSLPDQSFQSWPGLKTWNSSGHCWLTGNIASTPLTLHTLWSVPGIPSIYDCFYLFRWFQNERGSRRSQQKPGSDLRDVSPVFHASCCSVAVALNPLTGHLDSSHSDLGSNVLLTHFGFTVFAFLGFKWSWTSLNNSRPAYDSIKQTLAVWTQLCSPLAL